MIIANKVKDGSKTLTAASTKLKSNCRARAVDPRSAKTVRITLDRQNAVKLATQLLVLAEDEREGSIQIVGMNIRGKPGSRQLGAIKRVRKSALNG